MCVLFLLNFSIFVGRLQPTRLKARPMSSCGVCPSVLLFVTFVYCVKTNNHILKLFHDRVATPF